MKFRPLFCVSNFRTWIAGTRGGARWRALAQQYLSGLQGTRCVLPASCENSVPVYHHFVIAHPQRDALREYLDAHDVETAIYYPTPCHLQPAFHHLPATSCLSEAEWLADQSLALPIYPELSNAAVTHIVALVHSFERNRRHKSES